MMEADLGNFAFCPYVVFIYEAANADIDALLDGIVKDALR